MPPIGPCIRSRGGGGGSRGGGCRWGVGGSGEGDGNGTVTTCIVDGDVHGVDGEWEREGVVYGDACVCVGMWWLSSNTIILLYVLYHKSLK